MVTTRALSRRTHTERKVLALLRGQGGLACSTHAVRPNRASITTEPTPAQVRKFGELYRLSSGRGLTILSPGSPYMGSDERLLLSWLAGAQRTVRVMPLADDSAFLTAIMQCAALLDTMGLRLSPLTLYSARLQAADAGAACPVDHRV